MALALGRRRSRALARRSALAFDFDRDDADRTTVLHGDDVGACGRRRAAPSYWRQFSHSFLLMRPE
jgi:hypothetical protein